MKNKFFKDMNGKSILTVASVAIITLIIVSCSVDVTTRSRDFRDSAKWGKVVTKTLDIDEFTNIEVWASVDIEFVQSDTFRVEVEGNEKAIEEYNFTIECDTLENENAVPTLIVGWKERGNTNHIPTVRLHIYAPTLGMLDMEGEGDFTILDSISLDTLTIINNGVGDADIYSLNCKKLKGELNGTGDLSIHSLKAKDVKVSTSGTGDINFRNAKVKGDAKFTTVGTGDIDATVKAENISAKSEGTGDIELEVDCKEITILSEGAGNVTVEGDAKILKKNKQALGTTTTKRLHAKKVEEI